MENEGRVIGDGGKLNRHHVLMIRLPGQLVDEGLEGTGVCQVRILGIIAVGVNGGNGEDRAYADGISVVHVQRPYELYGPLAFPAEVDVAYQGSARKGVCSLWL